MVEGTGVTEGKLAHYMGRLHNIACIPCLKGEKCGWNPTKWKNKQFDDLRIATTEFLQLHGELHVDSIFSNLAAVEALSLHWKK